MIKLKQKIIELRQEHKTYNEISKLLGCTKSVVSYHLNDNVLKDSVARLKAGKKSSKEKAVVYKGGKCLLCGYSRCLQAMDFHHVDPTTKDKKVSESSNFETIKPELDKCVLLCANCHREVHAGVATIPGVEPEITQ